MKQGQDEAGTCLDIPVSGAKKEKKNRKQKRKQKKGRERNKRMPPCD